MEPVVSSAPFMPPICGRLGQHNVFLFGDLTSNFENDLRQLLHCRTNGTLQAFFDAVNLAFRCEFDLLPSEQREWLPRFTDLIDLMANVDSMVAKPALRSGLLCVYQVGRFILSVNSDFHADSALHPSDCHVMGVCTGMFAAAAVASSQTLSQLVPAGVEATLAAFRTGWRSFLSQRDILPGKGSVPRKWSFVSSLTETKGKELLQKFKDDIHLPPNSQPYLSAVTPSTVTISGPPHALDKLVDSFALKAHFIPIYTPYHASHLHGPHEVEQALGNLGEAFPTEHPLSMHLISTTTGEVVEKGSLRGLLRRAIDEALCQALRWDATCQSLVPTVEKHKGLESCVIFPIASDAATLLTSTLQKKTKLQVKISNALNAEIGKEQVRPAVGKFQDSKIAIVGFSGRYPEAASNDELWEKVLMTARNCVRTIPEDRFDWEAHYDPTGKKKNHSRVKYGCFINEPGLFDARFFNISAREAENADPAQRLILMSTYEAMEMAGMVPDRTASTQRDRVGVFFGTTSDDWREVNSGQNIDTYFIPGGNRAFVPGRISYVFRFSGPSISVDTACSSSFAAISTACSYLWQGDCDTAIAGGTNVLTNPDNFVGLDRGHFLSTTGNCNPFDDSASGYCRADAVGSVILKRLEDAVADKDPIFGVIAGASTNHCGQTVSITRPHEGDQLSLFRRILRHTNTDAKAVGYVEMHGTGTQAGDAAEMRSVLSAFAPDHSRSHSLHLGAIKANVGHAESASGVTALIKVLMMMQHNVIPPHRLDGKLNHNYPADMADRKVFIPFRTTPWRREDAAEGKRMAFLNNFSAAGGNTAVLLEDAPVRRQMGDDEVVEEDPRSMLPVAVSAKTSFALTANLAALGQHLEQNPHLSFAALSYTTTARRTHHPYRALLTGSNVAAITAALQRRAQDDEANKKPTRPERGHQVAFAFTGQGVMYAGIGKQLFAHVISFRADVVRFARIAEQHGFPSFLHIIIDDGDQDLTAESIDPVVAQLAVTCVQMALSHLWTLWLGAAPSSVIGHSLGEYAALYAAGVLSASDTIYLVGGRARLLNELCTKATHAMLAVKAPLSVVAEKLSGVDSCEVACINSPSDVVISGPTPDVKKLSDEFKGASVDSVRLDVPYAFHSAQVEPILARFATLTGAVHFNVPSVPYISPLLSTTVTDPGPLNAAYLVRAARECVNFQGALEAALHAKAIDHSTTWIEIGAHPACVSMIKKTLGSEVITLPTLRKDVDPWKLINAALESLYHQGADLRWDEFHRGFEAAQEVLALPLYKWDLKNYWIQYRNNFCLTKGDDPQAATPSTAGPAAPAYVYLSPSIQRVLEQKHGQDNSTLLAESDIKEPRLAPMFEGHKVNGVSLCPSSLYADMALTIAQHMMEANHMWSEKIGLNVSDVQVDKSLISTPGSKSQLVRMSASANWKQQSISMTIFSVDVHGKKLADHGSLIVKVTPNQNWVREWKRSSYLIRSRITTLRQAVNKGNAHHMKRGMVYKLFASIVDYDKRYQGIDEAVLDSDELEATAKVTFQVPDEGFRCSACWIDSLGHLAGFIMNGNDVLPKDMVFINHGWTDMRIATAPQYGKTYTTYNRMQLSEGTTYIGDTYILDGDTVIAIFEGVKFQGIPRRVLDHVLPPAGSKASPNKSSAPPRATGNSQQSAKLPSTSRQSSSAFTTTTKAAVNAPSKPAPQVNKVSALVQAIIAEEARLDPSEVAFDVDFNDLGVDSLLSLTISGRLQEELGLNIPTSAFTEYPTIGEFAKFVGGNEGSDDAKAEADAGYGSPPSTDTYGTDTPKSTISGSGYETNATSLAPDADDVDIMAIIRDVIAQETGAAPEDLVGSANLGELGMDSLLSLTVMGVLGEVLDAKLPSNLFAENETLQDVENTLGMNGYLAPKYDPPAERAATPATTPIEDSFPRATSVLLQGSAKSASRMLFLFPDGSGSAMSYASIPNISNDIAVYGLNCPWLKTPGDLKCSLEEYTSRFIVEIRRRQPQGPYYLGGWSAGGIVAYEAAQQLASQGDKTARLVLIDSPNPVGLENPPARMYDFFESLGLFGENGREPPNWLRPHFSAFIAMLDNYKIKPLSAKGSVSTHIVYARDGICKRPEDPRPEIRDDDPREMLWLLNNRTDFSASGWSDMVGQDNVTIQVLDEVNHFSLVAAGPKAGALSGFIADAMQ